MRLPFALLAGLFFSGAAAFGLPKDCDKELNTFCKELKPGESWRQCVDRQWNWFSQNCQNLIKAMDRRQSSWQTACHQDIRKLCSKPELPRDQVIPCLRSNLEQASPLCRELFAAEMGPEAEADGSGEAAE